MPLAEYEQLQFGNSKNDDMSDDTIETQEVKTGKVMA